MKTRAKQVGERWLAWNETAAASGHSLAAAIKNLRWETVRALYRADWRVNYLTG